LSYEKDDLILLKESTTTKDVYEICQDYDTSFFTQINHFKSRSHHTTLTNHHTSSKTRSKPTGVKQGPRDEKEHEERWESTINLG
jgi:hypothetical protein